jgi:hypothetical protein
MACEFSIPFTGDPMPVLDKVKSGIEKNSGSFTGDAQAGQFSIKVFGSTIAGSYTISGQNLQLVITGKPVFISCSQMESYLKSAVASYGS